MSKEILYALGVQLLEQGRYKDAVVQLNKVKDEAHHADDPALNYNLGLAYAHSGNFDDAIAALSVAARNGMYPRHSDALQSWVHSYYSKFNQELQINNLAAASVTFDAMLDSLPKDQDVSHQYLLNARSQLLKSYIEGGTALSVIIVAMGRYLDIGITVSNEDTLYFCANMGKIYLYYACLLPDDPSKQELLENAERLLQDAHAIEPTNKAVLNNLAIVEDTLGKWQDAVHLIASSAIIDGDPLKATLAAILINHVQTDLALKVTGDITDVKELIDELEAVV